MEMTISFSSSLNIKNNADVVTACRIENVMKYPQCVRWICDLRIDLVVHHVDWNKLCEFPHSARDGFLT